MQKIIIILVYTANSQFVASTQGVEYIVVKQEICLYY